MIGVANIKTYFIPTNYIENVSSIFYFFNIVNKFIEECFSWRFSIKSMFLTEIIMLSKLRHELPHELCRTNVGGIYGEGMEF